MNTAWLDNLDELNAAYAYVQNDRLFLMLTGNMNTNWNSIEIFIDSTDAVTTTVFEAAGNDNTDNLNGLVFDDGFTPDYHMNIRLGVWEGNYNFNVDYADLSSKAISYHLNLFEGSDGGVGYMGPGDASSGTMAIAFTNSNAAGLVSGTGSADQADVLAVSTGLELSIALSDIGNPFGNIRIMAMVTSNSHAEVSNQVLGGLGAPADALGISNEIDFGSEAGDQFFSLFSRPLPMPMITSMQMNSGSSEVQLDLSDLEVGYTYMVQDNTDLVNSSFTDMPGTDFDATNSTMMITVPADTGADSVIFYRVIAP